MIIWSAALWWASLTIIGFLVVPLLFKYLPSTVIAGNFAAKLFFVQTWTSIFCGCSIVFLRCFKNKISLDLQELNKIEIPVTVGVFLALGAQYFVAPKIQLRENLYFWHSLGSAMYLLQWVVATVFFWKITPSKDQV